jgi:hypothetical protein
MLRSEEKRAASFWKGCESENDNTKDVLAARIMDMLHFKNTYQIADVFGMDHDDICKIIALENKKKRSEGNKYWANVSRKATAKRKADIKKRAENYDKLHACIMK